MDDLIKPGVWVITPNPKSSGGARWNYLAAWGCTLHHRTTTIRQKHRICFGHCIKTSKFWILARAGSTNTFVERGIGDVLIAWENEALLAANELGKDEFEMARKMSLSSPEPTVSVVDKVVEKKGTKEVAEAYLECLLARRSGNCREKLLPSARR
ncbi:substrate-binding domain-containing protein [Escherichia coli]